MNSEQFKRICEVLEYSESGGYAEVETDGLQALVDDKLAAYERIKHLETRVAQIENLLRQALCGPLK